MECSAQVRQLILKKQQAIAIKQRYKKMIDAGLSMAEMGKRLNISRQGVDNALRKHGLRERFIFMQKKPVSIDALNLRIMYHLESARNLRKLANFLINEIEVASLESVSNALAKLIKEMNK